MTLKVNRTESKTAPKLFVGGVPEDFVITTTNAARVSGKRYGTDGKRYKIFIGAEVTQARVYNDVQVMDAAGLREVAAHFSELADIIEGKLKAA